MWSLLEKCGSSPGWEVGRTSYLPWQKDRPCQKACSQCCQSSAPVSALWWCGVPNKGHNPHMELWRATLTRELFGSTSPHMFIPQVMHIKFHMGTHNEIHQMVIGKPAGWISSFCWSRQWTLAKRVNDGKGCWHTIDTWWFQRCPVGHSRWSWDVQ